MPRQSAPIWEPALSARLSSCCVLSGALGARLSESPISLRVWFAAGRLVAFDGRPRPQILILEA
jgi:hypothetical protein